MTGNANAALYWYREANRLCPRDENAVMALSLLEQRRGQVDEAQRLLVDFLQDVDSGHVGALRQLGKIHQLDENWSKAAGCFQHLSKIDPANSEWPKQLQLCRDQMQTADGAGQPSNDQNGFFNMAMSLAEPILRNALPGDSKNQGSASQTGYETPSNRAAGGFFSASPGPQTPGSLGFSSNSKCASPGDAAVAAQLQDARRQSSNGHYEGALRIYDGLLRRDHRNSEALRGLADCQYELGNLDAALEAAKQLLGMRPDDPEANLRVAELLLASNHQPDMAQSYIKRAHASASGNDELQHRILCANAEAALAQEDHKRALSSASEAVRMDASSARALMLLGHARLCVAEYPTALRALKAASEASSSDREHSRRVRASIHALCAQVHERMRQYPQALQEVQRALDLSPQMWIARVVRATVMQQSGQDQEAEVELGAVLQREPKNAAALLQLGYCQLLRGDGRAVATLEKLVTGAGASRSQVGAAKMYLSMALDCSSDPSAQQRADVVAKEGLSLHRNLQHVWHDIQRGQDSEPVAAVQKLRGLCDLDLTSSQARQLLRLLARATGRSDMVRSLGGSTPPRSRGNRQSSIPPDRCFPGQQEGAPSRGAHSGYSTPGTAGGFRGRSVSPGRDPAGGKFLYGGGGGGTPYGRGGSRGGTGGDRSPMPALVPSADEPLSVGWNELIRPEQLSVGPRIGGGGSAEVYRGSWNGQEVAIKKMSGVAHVEEMKKEINALRRLRHPRLVRFIGTCVQPPLLVVVTEFMPGGSLHDRLFGCRRDPPINLMQKWSIGCQMAEGLAFLHSQRVVHRDLKSMNILLDANQNAKICDFGLAQQMRLEATSIARKIDGEGGSPRYMAPECYDAAHGKLTEKVDIWAIGCILIELFGGVLPYAECSSMAQLSARILVERRPPDVPQTVVPAFAQVIRRCVSFDPSSRFTALELQAELARLKPR